jgi:DNA-binding PadR family transcriptional regulator
MYVDMSVSIHKGKSEIELGMLQMQILWLLSRKSTHGYDLMKSLSSLKNTKITQGTLYPTLQRLEELKMVRREKDGRKIIYHLTQEGKAQMTNACNDFSRTFFGIFNDFVCGKCHSGDMKFKERIE